MCVGVHITPCTLASSRLFSVQRYIKKLGDEAIIHYITYIALYMYVLQASFLLYNNELQELIKEQIDYFRPSIQ